MEIVKLKPVTELTLGQQQLLHAILSMNTVVFTTPELQSVIGFMSGESLGGVLGSLSRGGYIERLSAGRAKRWRVATVVIENRTRIVFDLLAVGVGRPVRSIPQPQLQRKSDTPERSEAAELIAELERTELPTIG